MKINVDEYEANRESLIKLYKAHGESRAVEMAIFSGIPLLALYTFLKEEFGGFEDDIQRLIEFYGYTEIRRENV